MTTRRSASAAADADRPALLGGPLAHARLEPVRVADLARVRAQRLDLAFERRGDVDPGARAVRPEEVEPTDAMRREAAASQRREGHRVARRRVDRIDRGQAGGAMVGVVDAAVVVEERLGVGGEDGVRPEGPDLADEQLAQGEVVGQRAVGPMEEGDARVADDAAAARCSRLAERGELERVGVRGPRRPGRRWCSTRASPRRPASIQRAAVPGRPELGVVGVGGDDHEPAGRQSCGRDRRRRSCRRSPDARSSRVIACSAQGAAVPFRPRLRSSPPTSEVSFDSRQRVTRRAPPAASSSAASTSAAWPSGFTFGQVRAIRPSGSTRKVVRAVPQ